MSLSRVVLWRHGQTEHNASGKWQGHLDSPLTEQGLAQAAAAVPALATLEPGLVVSSDLRRAADTARVFVEATGTPLRIDKRLRETDIGQWQGLTSAEVEQRFPGGIHTWQYDPTWAPPGGETRVEVAARAAEVVAELDTELSGTVLLCAHGGLITALTGQLLGMPLSVWPLLGGHDNCHWAVLGRRPGGDGRWRLLSYNTGAA
ncbi:histidine phosphatase family protein [Kutzneria viridogrisea]|uniref:Phosphoglycerate mutase n=2 Tax=Kutzneria TaxID=43356 RepID=W5W9W5_9PSEU|nr:histidine phosphatase family protein [Kutzneria albida]AHH94999.1 phosphoglycerate mutase [Kutzneria albida DSM 43870]MBA8927645.1 broad specificity phosphatase PhoE [Kutzneria viridogrisea]